MQKKQKIKKKNERGVTIHTQRTYGYMCSNIFNCCNRKSMIQIRGREDEII
jgi:hypothetical protein